MRRAVLVAAALAACAPAEPEVGVGFIHVDDGVQQIRYEVIEGMPTYQGDIAVDLEDIFATREEAEAARGLRAGFRRKGRWIGGVVPIEYDPLIHHVERIAVEDAMKEWARHAEVRFVPRTTEVDYVRVSYVPGVCRSKIGRQGGMQNLDVSMPGCSPSAILHEVGHTLGFHHEMARSDRDAHVDIHWGNIVPAAVFNFEKYDVSFRDHGAFDFASIMMYPPGDFAIDASKPTISSKAGVAWGDNTVLSAGDVDAVRTMYGLYGSIRARWDAIGGAASHLGRHTTGEDWMDDGWGRFNEFERGAILFHWDRGAFDVPAGIYAYWQTRGGTAGLGYPSREPSWVSGGGVAQDFDGGTVCFKEGLGAHTVINGIRARWYALYGPHGTLGLAKTDEVGTGRDPYGRMTEFEGGVIYWHPSTDAWAVRGPFLPHFRANNGLWTYGYPKGDQRTLDYASGLLEQEFQKAYLRYSPATGVTVHPKTVIIPPKFPRPF